MKIIYQGLGNKKAFNNWVLITHYQNGNVRIATISKRAYNMLLEAGYSEEG